LPEHGKQTPDASLMRVATAALDEAEGYLRVRIGTYDEQPGEAETARRIRAASAELKTRLAAHVLDSLPDKSREPPKGR
jgi:hypothetical protein